jgi:hypothetical protein
MAKMSQKQKGMLLLTVVALLFLGWQVYNLISDDLSRRPQATNPLTSRAYSAPATNATTAAPAASSAPLASIPEQDANPNAAAPKAENELPPELVKSLTFPARPEYLRLANQYQMAKMQRQLLEEQVAIANAQAQITKLGTSTVSGGASAPADLSVASGAGLELVSVAEQAGAWSATLNQNGAYQSVGVGTRLPGDIEILSIDKEGVVFNQESTRKKLTFNGMIILSKPAPVKQTPLEQTIKVSEQKATGVTNEAK